MGETFYDEVVGMDDADYTDATFTKCEMRYSGKPASFVHCRFDHCMLMLSGPAANTRKILADWAQGYLDQGISYERTWDLIFGEEGP